MPTLTRLDRLSALLEGLAPRVVVSQPPAGLAVLQIDAESTLFLHLHLLAEGCMQVDLPGAAGITLSAPAIVVCRSDTPHRLALESADALPRLMCARAFLDGPVAALLLDEFAEPQVVGLDAAETSLGHVIKLISAELQAPRCGQPALLDRAGDILFIGLLRHLIAHPKRVGGLLSGLADPRIARALVAIHGQPQGRWTLEALAGEAGMSRTAFANTFREVMRQTPGKYLANIRLAIARRAVHAGKGMKLAARQAGYGNVSALSRALSRRPDEGETAAPSAPAAGLGLQGRQDGGDAAVFNANRT